MDPQGREEFINFMEWVCEQFHDKVEAAVNKPGVTDAEIAAVGEVEQICLTAFQILLHIHDPVASFDKPESEDGS